MKNENRSRCTCQESCELLQQFGFLEEGTI